MHLADFMAVYDFARRLETLSGLTPYDYVAKIWTSEPNRQSDPPDAGNKHLDALFSVMKLDGLPARSGITA